MNKVIVDSISIDMHSAQSDFYEYRTPYIPKLFNAICEDIGVRKNSTLMDLGCGRGEVSGILANYAGKVYGIDGSQEMIDLAAKKENIEYQVVDLNLKNPSILNKVDHLFFGRSIHWFSADSLNRLASDLLIDGGKIVVCSTQWAPIGEWGGVYFRTKEKFVTNMQRQRPDFTGKSNLGDAGFSPVKRFTVEADIKVSTDFMIGHTFSTTYQESLVNLRRQVIEFEQEMSDALKSYTQLDQLVMKVTSWAIIYEVTAPSVCRSTIVNS